MGAKKKSKVKEPVKSKLLEVLYDNSESKPFIVRHLEATPKGFEIKVTKFKESLDVAIFVNNLLFIIEEGLEE